MSMLRPSSAPSRLQALTLGSLCLASLALPSSHGAIWESAFWALSGKADVSAGYDSNLFAIQGGPSDTFATYRPSLLLTRKDSPLTVDTEAWAGWTTFERQTGNDSVDPGIRVMLAYPANVPDTTPTQTGDIHWIRSTSVNVDVGNRVSQQDAAASYAGNLYDTGKLSVAGRTGFDRDEYLGAAYTTINTATLGSTVSYSPQELFKAGLGYDLTLGRSTPNTPGPGALDRTEHAFTAQASGEFGPAVTGTLAVGEAYSNYTGFFSNSDWDVVAAADLTWKPRERLAIDLKASRAPSFSADGDVVRNTTLSLGARQNLARGFAVRVDGMVGNNAHERIVTYRKDRIEGLGGGLDYNLTGKLVASLGYEWTHQSSDATLFNYHRNEVNAQVQYLF